jgi:hypothetical protein
MNCVRAMFVALAGVAMFASAGLAQSSGTTAPGATAGPGTGTTITPSGGGQGNSDLDLPVEPVRAPFQTGITDDPPTPPTPITPDDDDGDDPRDTPPPVFYGEEMDTESDSIFYVIDTSCSMGWDVSSYSGLDGSMQSGPRLDRAKVELIRSISGLSDNFEFNIINYDCSTGQWRGSMAQATDANKQQARAWVMSLREGGATGTGPAVVQALGAERDNKMIVLLTDGAPNCGVPSQYGGWDDFDDAGPSGHRRVIRDANAQGATINVFGIAASGSYRAFCQGVASDSGGAYFDVP